MSNVATVIIDGTEKIRFVARRLRQMGTDRTIVNEMTKTIRRASAPAKKEIRASAKAILPRRGGLGEWVSKSTIRTSVRRTGRSAGVAIVVGKGEHDIRRMDAGRTRHPLWGNRKHWYLQNVEPGFGTKPLDGPIFDEFRKAVSDAIDLAVEQVTRGL